MSFKGALEHVVGFVVHALAIGLGLLVGVVLLHAAPSALTGVGVLGLWVAIGAVLGHFIAHWVQNRTGSSLVAALVHLLVYAVGYVVSYYVFVRQLPVLPWSDSRFLLLVVGLVALVFAGHLFSRDVRERVRK